MGIIKHVWIATLAAYLVFQFYKTIILPKLDAELLAYHSKLRADIFALSVSYILSSMAGAGLMTAFLNLVCISAAIMIVFPMLPKYYFPTGFAITSLVFVVLAAFQVLHYLISIPAAVCFAILSYYSFKSTFKSSHDIIVQTVPDMENSLLSESTPKKTPKFTKKEIFKAFGALFVSLITGIVILYWIMLSINPFWMRADRISKYETLHRLPHDTNLRVREVSSLADLKFYKNNIKSFPVVIKPSICTTNSRNIMKCDNYKCLKEYLTDRIAKGPIDDGKNGDKGAWVIQEYSSNVEGVVFYYKLPYMSGGAIKNIGIRDESDKGPLNKDASGNTLTARYWPGTFRTDFSPEYVKYFDNLAAKIPGYNGGRFDVMLPSNDLKDPRGLAVLELNVFFLGCIDEKSPKSLLNDLKRLRTSLVQLYIGIVNIVIGYNFSNFWGILFKLPDLFSRAIMCGNYEHIMAKP